MAWSPHLLPLRCSPSDSNSISYTLRELVTATPARRVEIIADQPALAATFFVVVALAIAAGLVGLFSSRLVAWFLLILATEHLSLEATRILIITSRPVRAYVGVFLRGGIWVYAIAALMLAIPGFALARNRPDLVGARRRGIDSVRGLLAARFAVARAQEQASRLGLDRRRPPRRAPVHADGWRRAHDFLCRPLHDRCLGRPGCARHLHVLFDDRDRHAVAGRLGVPSVPAQDHRGLVCRRRRLPQAPCARSSGRSRASRRHAGACRKLDIAVARYAAVDAIRASIGVFFLMLPGVLLGFWPMFPPMHCTRRRPTQAC